MVDPDIAVMDIAKDLLDFFYPGKGFFQVVPVDRTIDLHGVPEFFCSNAGGMVLRNCFRVEYPGIIREEGQRAVCRIRSAARGGIPDSLGFLPHLPETRFSGGNMQQHLFSHTAFFQSTSAERTVSGEYAFLLQ